MEKKNKIFLRLVHVGLVTFSMRNSSVLIQPNYWKTKKDQRNLNSIKVPKIVRISSVHTQTHTCAHTHAHTGALQLTGDCSGQNEVYLFTKLCLNDTTFLFRRVMKYNFFSFWASERLLGHTDHWRYTHPEGLGNLSSWILLSWNCFTDFKSQSEILFGSCEDGLWRYFWGLQNLCNRNIINSKCFHVTYISVSYFFL